MAKRPSSYERSRQAVKALQRERDRQLKELKRLGLITKKANLKSKIQRRNILKKFSDVLQGRAKVVTLPKGFKTKTLKKSFRVSGLNVVVPREKGERIRVEKRTGHITSTRIFKGERIKRIYHVGGELPKPRKGKKFMYVIPFANGGRVKFDDIDALADFMRGYSTYKNWRDYLEIEEVDADEDEGAEE